MPHAEQRAKQTPMFYKKLAEAKRHRPDMMDEFVRKDVEWGLSGRD